MRTLDGGGALDVSGIPDAFLRSRLALLLDNLVQLRRNSAVRMGRAGCLCERLGWGRSGCCRKLAGRSVRPAHRAPTPCPHSSPALPAAWQGQYFKRRGAEATVLSFVAPLLEESAEQLAPYKQASVQFGEEAAAAEAAAQAAEAAAGAAAAGGEAAEGEERPQRGASPAPAGPQIGPAGPPQQQRQQAQQEGLVDSEGDGSGGEAAGVIGPAAFPPGAGASGPAEEQQQQVEEEEQEHGVAGARRAAGPAMPPAEWLAAAAQVCGQAGRVGCAVHQALHLSCAQLLQAA